MLTKSNAVGYAVLALVIETLNESEVRELNIEPYLNGRENGFAVMFWPGSRLNSKRPDRKLVFSEQRRTDSIVVYEGKGHEFNMLGNGLTDEIYRNSTSFDFDKHLMAAQYIVQRLRGDEE